MSLLSALDWKEAATGITSDVHRRVSPSHMTSYSGACANTTRLGDEKCRLDPYVATDHGRLQKARLASAQAQLRMAVTSGRTWLNEA